MAYEPTNSTGWTELIDGNIIKASFIMFDTALGGWLVTFLFFTYQIILYLKAKNPTLNFITGSFFISMYLGAKAFYVVPIINPIAVNAIFLVLVLQLAAILFNAFWR